ncbi:uncharacterized protein LOC121541656 [Coregonus clupeaformis]|uniref:uncharacterized protein LOC121541656 n=1 Tax=Coregonus clupeaformis TaxID=59861 RepID=UPI001BE03DC8|nr:uncharacterized protein LOC121541656 [Coregonus clupeaformis]
MACPCQCHSESSLSMLLCPEPTHVKAALEGLSRSAQESKKQMVEEIVKAPKRESYTRALEHLLSSTDSWLCSTAAYHLGVLVEREEVVQQLQAPKGSNSLVGTLGQLLTRDDPDIVMNAAGALASLVESSAGREWLLRDQAVFGQVLNSLLTLLDQGRESMVNSAALILARLSLCEVACQGLLRHPSAPSTLGCLVQCLAHSHTDTAMNAAFALGRLCGSERGRSLILTFAPEYQLVHSLQALMSELAGPEAGQTACFALSCLVTEEDGHALVLGSSSLPSLLDALLYRLQTEDQDSAWFAAMAVKVFVSRPAGVLQVREHRFLKERLKSLSSSPSIGKDLREEVNSCLRKLEPLVKPLPPTTRRLPSGACTVSWEKCFPECGLEVTYSLLDRETVLYRGTQCHVTLPVSVLKPGHEFSLRLIHSTSDGDTSSCSEPVLLAIESEGTGTRPGPPQELRVIGCTTSHVRLSWVAPAGELKPKVYQLYRGETLLDTTTELKAVVGGLSPGTLFQLGVCAVGPGEEVGPCAEVEVRTAKDQDHAPSGLTMVVLGRHELQIMWGAPLVPLGRLFNYELRLNGRVAYLGTERAHTARHLAANTAYTCTVAAITTRGRSQSQSVTKRTARDEYPHTQRCLYSPSRQPPPKTHPSPPSVTEATEVRRKVTEVREKAMKPHSTHSHLTKVHLSSRRYRGTDHNRERHRQPLVSTSSSGCESSKIESSEMMTMGLVNGYDAKALWRRAKERAGVSVCPAVLPVRPLLHLQAKTEENLLERQSHRGMDQPLDPSCLRAQISPGMLLQWSALRRGPRDRGKLPCIPHHIDAVKLVDPIPPSYTQQDWTGNYKDKLLRDRTRLLTGPRVQSEIRGRYPLTTNWTKLS